MKKDKKTPPKKTETPAVIAKKCSNCGKMVYYPCYTSSEVKNCSER